MEQIKKQAKFEIGVVYRKAGRFYLAVTDRILITFKDGELVEVRPYQRYDMVRSLAVEELCGEWGIPLSRLDETSAKYLAPDPTLLKSRPRGSRRKRAAEEQAWRQLRTIRLVAG